jgi:Na+/H+-translocating membrane pyrophosphatase
MDSTGSSMVPSESAVRAEPEARVADALSTVVGKDEDVPPLTEFAEQPISEQPAMDQNLPADQREGPSSEPYVGYQPRTLQDFRDATLPTRSEDGQSEIQHGAGGGRDVVTVEAAIDPSMLKDKPTIDRAAVTGFLFAIVVAIALIVLLGLGSRCRAGICSVTDRSTGEAASYAFDTYRFNVPVQHVLSVLLASSACAAILALFAVLVIREDVGAPGLVAKGARIRAGSRGFLIREFIFLSPIVIALFIVIGFGANWRAAGCFAIGAAISALVGWFCTSIGTRGTTRLAAAMEHGALGASKVTLLVASVLSLTIVSSGLGGIALCYLIFQDVQALIGFCAGVSTFALIARSTGGCFAEGSNMNSYIYSVENGGAQREGPSVEESIVEKVAENLNGIAAVISDTLESYVGSIVAACILAASLPYFTDNQYALCVYNHLYIDKSCVGYPNRSAPPSISRQICRLDNFFSEYKTSARSPSTSLFIALPLMVGLVGGLCTIVSTVFTLTYNPTSGKTTGKDQSSVIKRVNNSTRMNIVLSTVLTTAGMAALCWGFFGQNSSFQSGLAGTTRKGFLRYEIKKEGIIGRCALKSTGIPEGQFVRGPYRPIDSFGKFMPASAQIPWRLFLCIVLGISLGIADALVTEYMTGANYAPTLQVAASGRYGVAAVILRGVGVGMISVLLHIALVLATILGAHNLFGPYGVGLAAVGLVTSTCATAATWLSEPVLCSARSISSVDREPHSHLRHPGDFEEHVRRLAGSARCLSCVTAILTAYALFVVLVQSSSLIPSPRQLGGTLSSDPLKRVSSADEINLMDIYVAASTFGGLIAPYAVAALALFALSQCAMELRSNIKAQQHSEMGKADSFAVMSPFIDAVPLVALSIMCSLIVGFGLGQRALIGSALGVMVSGFTLAIMVSNSGESWSNAKLFTDSGSFGEKNGPGSHWSKAILAAECFGKPLKGTVGPALRGLMKIVPSYGVIAIPVMQVGPTRGWIGAILLICLMLGAGFALIYRERSTARIRRQYAPLKKKHELTDGLGGPLGSSPFYEPGPGIPTACLAPGSQLLAEHKALTMSGEEHHGALSLPAYVEYAEAPQNQTAT